MEEIKEKVRYSDEELQEFKEIILKKLEKAREDLKMYNDVVASMNKSGDDTSPTFKAFEDGSTVLAKEENAQLAYRQYKIIQSLENALVRIENKTYGVDRMTGKLIPKERLRIVPHATLSIESKNNQKKR